MYLDIILEFDILGFIAILISCTSLGVIVTFGVLKKKYREDYFHWRCKYLSLRKKLLDYIEEHEKG